MTILKSLPSLNRRLLLTLLSAFISFHSLAQETLSGVVMEENEKGKLQSIPGVNIYWKGTTIGTSTDVNGVFKIEDDHTNHVLIISYVGYENDTVDIINHEDLMVVLKNARVIDEVEIVYRQKATSLSFMDSRHTEVLNEKELFKAACCNLSESFETNATVDASFTDAVSGTRQIQMLGLAGIYSQILQENIPVNRGLATVYGLTYLPGAWIEQISVSKGTGAVVAGYESMTGQLNTEIRKPETGDKLYVNAYGNMAGRLELNTDYKIRLNERWSTSFLLHGRTLRARNDRNDDGFMDMPLNETFVGMNRWRYQGVKGLESQLSVKYINVINRGGQVAHDFGKSYDDQSTWGMQFATERIEGVAKVGIVFPEKRYRSLGLQLYAVSHNHDSYFGKRIYNGKEQSFYSNLIYQDILGSTNHKVKFGLSFLHDDFKEVLDTNKYNRTEQVPGGFIEYTWTISESLNAVAGMRADYHNLYGMIYSPRLHIRYAMTKQTVLRLSGGMGTRVTNVIAENSGYLASSRNFVIPSNDNAFGLNPEKAVNAGISVSQNFTLDYREGSIVVDYFRTEFLEQTVVDLDQNAQEVNFYNLNGGKSFANSFQIELNYEVLKRLDLKLAYRVYDVQTDYLSGRLTKQLLARNKGFVNLGYETKKNLKFGNWKFDVTYQIIGQQRLPDTRSNPDEYQLERSAPGYGLLSAQITRAFNKKFEIYVGGENLTDYKQDNPIISADNPYGSYYDASLIYAPIFGTNVYAGLRFRIL